MDLLIGELVVSEALGRDVEVKGVFKNTFMMFTTTDTHIFKYFYCILFNFLSIFFIFFPIIMKSCFPFSISKFHEMFPFSVSWKIYGFSIGQ